MSFEKNLRHYIATAKTEALGIVSNTLAALRTIHQYQLQSLNKDQFIKTLRTENDVDTFDRELRNQIFELLCDGILRGNVKTTSGDLSLISDFMQSKKKYIDHKRSRTSITRCLSNDEILSRYRGAPSLEQLTHDYLDARSQAATVGVDIASAIEWIRGTYHAEALLHSSLLSSESTPPAVEAEGEQDVLQLWEDAIKQELENYTYGGDKEVFKRRITDWINIKIKKSTTTNKRYNEGCTTIGHDLGIACRKIIPFMIKKYNITSLNEFIK